jgi:hypothetical protein
MAEKRATTFHHRQNRDGSFDSICSRCYRTVSSGQVQSNLVPAENLHTCNPADLPHACIQAP